VTVPVGRRRGWAPPVAALLTALVGLINLVSALTREDRSRLRALSSVVPGALTTASTGVTVVTGLLLLLLAHALRRRKRRAWQATVALLAGSVVLHVLKGLDVEEALVAAALLVLLVVLRDEFRAEGDPRTRWRAVVVLVQLLAADVLLGLVVLSAHDTGAGWWDRLSHVLQGLVGLQGPVLFATGRDDDVVSAVLGALGILTVLLPAYLALRPAEPVAVLGPAEEQQLRALLDRHGGRDSLGYFALRRDKSVVWSPTGKAAVSYRVVSGVCLASGDPLGDPEAWPGAIAAMLELADRHAWVPAVMGCSELGGTAWHRAGLQALELGDEAVLETASFSLDGRAMRGVRQAVRRVERAGYSCRVRRVHELSQAELDDVRRVAQSWRDGETERGFSMALGRFGDPADGECVLVTAERDGQLRGLLHFVPWGSDGLSLDLMRRDRQSENGINELLVHAAVQAAGALGISRLSLNFAVFRAALERGERLGAGPVTRAWRSMLVFASRWWQIESLYRFNAKFGPEWEPRFVCFRNSRDLPRVAVAALEAEAFLVWPDLSPRPLLRRLVRVRHPA
jgi:lysyl-tRNA synthetase class 2